MVRWREATREGLSGLLEKNGDLYTKDIGEGFQKFQILPTNAKEEEESSSAEVQAAKEPIGRFPFVMLMMTRIYTIAITAKKLPPFYQPRARSGYQQKDRKPSQNDKTEHGMEKTVQNQGQSPKMPKSESIQKNQQSNRRPARH
ncbi:hypothetical protein Tco_0052155 [Tanacetum coccineum]